MTSINEKYSTLNYQTLSDQEIEKEYKKITTGILNLSKVEMKSRLTMLISISNERGFFLPQVDFEDTSINERTAHKPDLAFAIRKSRKVNINYGKLIFGIIFLGAGVFMRYAEHRPSYTMIVLGLAMTINSFNDPDY